MAAEFLHGVHDGRQLSCAPPADDAIFNVQLNIPVETMEAVVRYENCRRNFVMHFLQ